MASYEQYSDELQSTKIAYINGDPKTLHIRRAQLIVYPGTTKQREYAFDQNVIKIGSLDDNDIVLDDETVSRHHCRILQEENSYVVIDLTSTNGTHINAVRIKEAYLAPGGILHVGNTQIRFNPIDEQVEVTPSKSERLGSIVGKSIKMREIFHILEKIAPTSATVVIEGETGTGKEVVAQTVHTMSPRKDKPFIVFDCGAVPESLIESELFGHEKGSFTGAIMTRKGLFEMAQGGTIFLDELGELSIDLQPKLLRVLEQREVRRVGSNKAIPINVRVIAATNRSLEDEVRAGRFREDLFYRLSVMRLFLPSLRERREDISLLIEHFLDKMDCNRDFDGHRRIWRVSAEAMGALSGYDWPGNVRELANVIERACSFAETETLSLADLPDYISGVASPDGFPSFGSLGRESVEQWNDVPNKSDLKEQPFKEAKEQWISTFERDYISELLQRHSGNISQAAREADIDRKYFRKLMSKYGIAADEI
ncbi:MAG: sigma 54-dependent Fis family transcriptional regulator [Bradymonadaceae bacterium]|nr:sigma 54-dependent Fis family transcriptional regulator [Lujinxingiaceae bacterium]